MVLIAALAIGQAIQKAIPVDEHAPIQKDSDIASMIGPYSMAPTAEKLPQFSKFCKDGYAIEKQSWQPLVLDASPRSRLAIQHDGVFLQLNSMKQLVGKVQMKNSDDALAFVRLLTCPITERYLGSTWKRNCADVLMDRRSAS